MYHFQTEEFWRGIRAQWPKVSNLPLDYLSMSAQALGPYTDPSLEKYVLRASTRYQREVDAYRYQCKRG